MDGECRKFLRLCTIDAHYEKGYDKAGGRLSDMNSHWNGAILSEVQREFEKTPQWQQYQDALLEVAEAQGAGGGQDSSDTALNDDRIEEPAADSTATAAKRLGTLRKAAGRAKLAEKLRTEVILNAIVPMPEKRELVEAIREFLPLETDSRKPIGTAKLPGLNTPFPDISTEADIHKNLSDDEAVTFHLEHAVARAEASLGKQLLGLPQSWVAQREAGEYPITTSEIGPSEAVRSGGETVFAHSPDYRSIRFNGQPHTLTRNQAVIIKILHEAFQQGTPSVGKSTLLSAVESETSRMQDFFRDSPDARC